MQRNYAKAFRVIRAAFGLRQSDLAERMPITASQLSLIEAGKRQPSVKVVDGLAAAVGIPPALITLLASTPEEIKTTQELDISDLAKTLLRTLVAASEEPQGSLRLEG